MRLEVSNITKTDMQRLEHACGRKAHTIAAKRLDG
jgi:hypothetical protein